MGVEPSPTSHDAVLDGRLTLRQPRAGHRVGHDAILLAAATGARAGEHAADLGAGVGGAGLALARRVEGLNVTLVEVDPELVALAAENVAHNGFAARVRAVCLDAAGPAASFARAGLAPGTMAHVLMNPPFNAQRQQASPDRSRRFAHVAAPGTLNQWVRTAARLLHPTGVLTLIWRADGLDAAVQALAAGFGALALLPVHPKPAVPAIRVLMRAVKGGRAPLSLLPGLILADATGNPTAEAEAVLRGGAALPLADV